MVVNREAQKCVSLFFVRKVVEVTTDVENWGEETRLPPVLLNGGLYF